MNLPRQVEERFAAAASRAFLHGETKQQRIANNETEFAAWRNTVSSSHEDETSQPVDHGRKRATATSDDVAATLLLFQQQPLPTIKKEDVIPTVQPSKYLDKHGIDLSQIQIDSKTVTTPLSKPFFIDVSTLCKQYGTALRSPLRNKLVAVDDKKYFVLHVVPRQSNALMVPIVAKSTFTGQYQGLPRYTCELRHDSSNWAIARVDSLRVLQSKIVSKIKFVGKESWVMLADIPANTNPPTARPTKRSLEEDHENPRSQPTKTPRQSKPMGTAPWPLHPPFVPQLFQQSAQSPSSFPIPSLAPKESPLQPFIPVKEQQKLFNFSQHSSSTGSSSSSKSPVEQSVRRMKSLQHKLSSLIDEE